VEAPEEAVRVWWDEASGVVRIQWLPGADLTLGNARMVTTVGQGFTADPPLVLVDVRGLTGKLDRSGRKHLIDELDKLTAMALLVDSPLSTMIANVYIRIQRRRIPMMLFTKEQAALDWLVGRRG
jgi:hypothetical protein